VKWLLGVTAGVVMLAGTTLTPMLMTSTMGMATSAGDAGSSCSAPAPSIAAQIGDPGEISAIVEDRRVTLDAEQIGFARAILDTGRTLKVPERGWVVAIATALQESTLQNLTYGDRDSIGLFQQRDAWGSRSQRLDPAESTTMFYTGGHAGQRGLLDISGWHLMSVAGAAQAVQASAFPSAYARWETLATRTVAALSGGQPPAPAVTCPPEPDPVAEADSPEAPEAVRTMLAAALAQQGDPYIWGATGPDSFDCSGLVIWSWRQAGYRVNMRTAADMYRAADPVEPGQERPGDLLFSGWGETRPGAGHVEIVVKRGTVVEAPYTGEVVKVRQYTAGGEYKLARLKASALTKV
jgi:peptidoglycan DL-endopeptidase CwlO